MKLEIFLQKRLALFIRIMSFEFSNEKITIHVINRFMYHVTKKINMLN